MSLKNSTTSGGLSMLGVAQALLLVDQLTGQIDISWWWVFSPTLLTFGLYGVFVVLALACFGIATFSTAIANKLLKRK